MAGMGVHRPVLNGLNGPASGAPDAVDVRSTESTPSESTGTSTKRVRHAGTVYGGSKGKAERDECGEAVAVLKREKDAAEALLATVAQALEGLEAQWRLDGARPCANELAAVRALIPHA